MAFSQSIVLTPSHDIHLLTTRVLYPILVRRWLFTQTTLIHHRHTTHCTILIHHPDTTNFVILVCNLDTTNLTTYVCCLDITNLTATLVRHLDTTDSTINFVRDLCSKEFTKLAPPLFVVAQSALIKAAWHNRRAKSKGFLGWVRGTIDNFHTFSARALVCQLDTINHTTPHIRHLDTTNSMTTLVRHLDTITILQFWLVFNWD